MARNIQQIYDSIIAEKNTFSTLSGLVPANDSYTSLLADINAASKVAIWRLWAYVVAAAMSVHEQLWDVYRADVDERALAQRIGSLPWYVRIAKEFQLGDALTWVDDFLVYDPVDPTHQIVKYAAANVSGRTIFLKVVKEVSGVLTPLSSGELTQFRAYIANRKPPGIKVETISLSADTLQYVLVVGYDPLFDPVVVQANVTAAITAYLKALPFDAAFDRLKFEDAIQAVEGVVTITTNALNALQGAVSYVVGQRYTAKAGHMIIDPGAAITMTPVS